MALQNSINAPTPISVANGGIGGSTLTQHGILLGQGTSAITSSVLTDGQLLIGSTGNDPVAATISAGAGISVTNAAGSITIAATGGASWTFVSGTSQTMAAGGAYVANNAGLVTLTLPATAAQGTEISVEGMGAGGFLVAQNAGQKIYFGNLSTTTGVGGSIASSQQYDGLTLLCLVADTEWKVIESNGNLDVV